MGRVKLKVLPTPNSLSTQMRPPCISTMDLTIDKPKPVPPCSPYHRMVGSEKTAEQFGLIVGRDTDAGIGHPGHDEFVIAADRDGNLASQ